LIRQKIEGDGQRGRPEYIHKTQSFDLKMMLHEFIRQCVKITSTCMLQHFIPHFYSQNFSAVIDANNIECLFIEAHS
jgi:hypothetical protein